MPTLLHIDSSPLPNSVSRELTSEFAVAWKEAHGQANVIYRNLAAVPPPPIDADWISAAYTKPDALTPDQAQKLALSDELIHELEQADEYVIGVAMHNFSIPSVLKLWIDQVARAGRTFSYSDRGPQGLLRNKKATVVVATGGVYAPGTPAAAMNYIEPYLKSVLAFLGVTDVRFITAGGTARVRSGSVDRAVFLKPALQEVRTAAA